MSDPQIAATLAALRHSLTERLDPRGGRIEEMVHRAGRRLPRRLRPAAEVVITAERLSANPRLATRIDPARLARAARDLTGWLDTQDPRDRRRGALADAAARVALVLLVTAGLVVTTLVWRGLV